MLLINQGEATIMIGMSTSPNRSTRLHASVGSLLMLFLVGAGCGSDGIGPSAEAILPADSVATVPTDSTTPGDTIATPPDSTALPPVDSTAGGTIVPALDGSLLPGVAFGATNLAPSYLSSVLTGTMMGGPLGPGTIVSVLTTVRSKGGRIVVKLCKGSDSYVKNSDGTFSLAKWKALIDQYRNVNLGPFIADGTILGHYLIDEPHRAVRWGGKIISHATLEEMAAYSKKIWPTMPAVVRVVPSWLATSPIRYTHLDAGWLQYTANKGEVTKQVAAEVAAAKLKGMNVVAGGNGSSGIRIMSGSWAMSATELRTYGSALLAQSYVCGFFMWNHNTTYYARSDIKAAMTELSSKARSHAKTSCRQ
jgi:hypothetical protein